MSSSASLLTSLLNNLHTHLQSQTQLLPTLHAQLGLPETALEDELRTLQQQLMHSVDSQVDTRRKQVEEWMEKCELVEADCKQYTKALGGNIKATGSSLGDLRKEHVLPRRSEMLAEYQEKLRQLYHTKLEQLSTLTNRICVIARTVGPDFYAKEITEPTPVEGALDTSHRDVTPERFSKLEKELVRGKAEVSKRLAQLSNTFTDIDFLYAELGIVPPSIEELSPLMASCISSSNASMFPGSSSSLCASRLEPFRTSSPNPESFLNSSYRSPTLGAGIEPSETAYQYHFAKFVARVEEAEAESLPEHPSVPLGLEGVEPTQGLLAWASGLRGSLEDTKRRRESHIQAMYDQLEALWRRLGVAEQDMDAFVENHRGSTEETVREYEDELERMLELKRERMWVFVGSAREEIQRLWDDLLVGEDERADFAPFADDEATEELLTIHEEEIRRLKDERRMKAPLLASIKKYFEICEEEKELAAAASDQTRLLGRGSRDPGRLLREEKMRKRVSKEKPRLEQDLLNSIPSWESEAGRPFLVHGESILLLLMETASAADQENKKKPRAGSVPARATTPVNHTGYAPAKGVVTPSVRPASSMSSAHSAPNKRQKTGDPTASNGRSTTGRAPLGSNRGGNINAQPPRNVSPSKIPGKAHRERVPSGGQSALPRPIAMPVPKPGTQHHALGHGRIPGGGVLHGNIGYTASGIRSASTVNHAHARAPSAGGVARKASRARRESFKPRPSIDAVDLGVHAGGLRWGGLGVSVKEEDEDY